MLMHKIPIAYLEISSWRGISPGAIHFYGELNFNGNKIKLVKKLSQFQEIVLSSYKNLNPSLLANFSYQLAKTFNEFYHECPVINDDNEDFRLALVQSFRYVLKNSLNLLGIDVLEKM